MNKIVYVNTEIQAAMMNQVLIDEMMSGFWKDGRPKGANQAWEGVKAKAGNVFGASGFTIPRMYNYLNPLFLKERGERLLAVAQTVDPTVTMKRLHRELTELSRIVGGRVKEAGGTITKLNRGQKSASTKRSATNVTIRKAPAIVSTPEPALELAAEVE